MFTIDEKYELQSLLHERLKDYYELKRIFAESNGDNSEWMINRYEKRIQNIYQIAIKLEIDPTDIEYGIR